VVVGVTGSSGPQLARNLLGHLQALAVETHLVISHGAERSVEIELGCPASTLAALADVSYRDDDLAAAISSGSFLTAGMVVVPCSMHTVGAIASGNTGTLLTRAADVHLKERRRLVVVPRETPLHLLHLRALTALCEAGATILPPVPAFYHQPARIEDLLDHVSGKVLDQLGVEHDLFRRWTGA
jgi:polyprenyl P-hydroxybenzoate/phenylacrylic acid decarboxylase-like protein